LLKQAGNYGNYIADVGLLSLTYIVGYILYSILSLHLNILLIFSEGGKPENPKKNPRGMGEDII